jgi:hypothetical protein
MLASGGTLLQTPARSTRHLRQEANDADDAEQPEDTQDRRVLAHTRNEDGEDDDEVEDVPAVPEEVLRPPAVRRDSQSKLGQEDREADVVSGVEHRAVFALDVGVGLEAEDDGVDDDHADDEPVEAV